MCTSNRGTIRRRFTIRGQVQGVGFRPHIHRLAVEHGLAGFVVNDGNGATIEVEGPGIDLDRFGKDLVAKLPPLAHITKLESEEISAIGDTSFLIQASESDGRSRPEVTPDASTCADCLRELMDPEDRRYRYPFINCTNCGPRYSIIRAVPYDRPCTTMAEFVMCPKCQAEYDDPSHRRFHAQPNACPDCGPQLTLLLPDRTEIDGDPIVEAARLLNKGNILAIKGLGGYHLACKAEDEAVVEELRRRKIRDGKPLAVMVRSIEEADSLCHLDDESRRVLASPMAPIVLAPKRTEHGLADAVAPGCGDFGVMLPYTPVHHLLMAEGVGPLVMTSANLTGQPLTYRDEDAFAGLGSVADAFLAHNREIFRPIDDSVMFVSRECVSPIRRSRGYAPRPIHLSSLDSADHVLAVGGELKSTVCLLNKGEAVVGEHLGDLGHADTYRSFTRAIDRLEELFGFTPRVVAHDMHPRYMSTQYALGLGVPTVAVQHHHAHIASVMAEHDETGPVLGLSCDGTGYGTDGAIWGCEILHCEKGEFERAGQFEYFKLVGGDAAAVETWRPAAALVQQALGNDWRKIAVRAFVDVPDEAQGIFERQIQAGINAPDTSSLGRVFDAVAFLVGLCRENRHEAEAAMALEDAASQVEQAVPPYAYELIDSDGYLQMSIKPMVSEILNDLRDQQSSSLIAARFHETLSQMLAEAAQNVCSARNIGTVCLSGGCFCNKRLLNRLIELLQAESLKVLYHKQLPCGDGGLSLGQAAVAAWRGVRT